MAKIVTTDQMRAIEQAADSAGQSYADMMQMAGRAVALRAAALVAGIDEPRIAILVGPGNNGGDGLVAGRVLLEEVPGAQVGAYLLKPRDPAEDPVFEAAQAAGLFIADADNDADKGYRVLKNMIANADIVIDALFGTSVRLPLEGTAAKILTHTRQAINERRRAAPRPPYRTLTAAPAGPPRPASHPLIVAVDCPSGLHCDTGEIDANTLHADETVTFAAAKPGLFMFPAAEAVGTLHVADIGLPPDLDAINAITFEIIDPHDVGRRLPARPTNSHKGTFGKAMIVSGSLNYQGAAYLSASAAYRVGTGLVTVAAPQIIIPTLAGMLPEATWLLLPHTLGVLNENGVKVLRQNLDGYAAMLVGPGLGQEDDTRSFLRALLRPTGTADPAHSIGFVHQSEPAAAEENPAALPPLVIDADGLNILAQTPDWPDLVPPGSILTPHPGEFGRLTGMSIQDVQADRVSLAREAAQAWDCVVVLKGAYTVVAAPDGRTALVPFASAALASAGTGDVLSGTIAGLRAQGLEPYDAAIVGGWLHGMAGLHSAAQQGTTASVVAGDVLAHLADAYTLAERAR